MSLCGVCKGGWCFYYLPGAACEGSFSLSTAKILLGVAGDDGCFFNMGISSFSSFSTGDSASCCIFVVVHKGRKRCGSFVSSMFCCSFQTIYLLSFSTVCVRSWMIILLKEKKTKLVQNLLIFKKRLSDFCLEISCYNRTN